MAWRVHLSNQAIQQLDLLQGKMPLVAAWTRRARVTFHGVESGAVFGERTLEVPDSDRESEDWSAFVADLTAPNGACLPVVRTPEVTIYAGDSGKMRLYHAGGTHLFFAENGSETELPVKDAGSEPAFVAVGLDSQTCITAAADREGKLHIYNQTERVGSFDVGLKPDYGLAPQVAVAQGGTIYASDAGQIVVVDAKGKVANRLETHYPIGRMACSTDGKLLVTSDAETGVIRVYSGPDLKPLRQRFGIDLLADATQVQLLADLPPVKVAPGALAIANDGTLAFALSGVVCVLDVEEMDEVPRPQPLA